jgi:hypothetical protein
MFHIDHRVASPAPITPPDLRARGIWFPTS